MTAEIDLARLHALRSLTATGFTEIVGELIGGLTTAIAEIESGIAKDALDAVAQAAHRGRNDALMFGGKEVLEALTEIEQAARDGRREPLRDGIARLRATWPSTRLELQRLMQEDQ